jgi:hypothetical protein
MFLFKTFPSLEPELVFNMIASRDAVCSLIRTDAHTYAVGHVRGLKSVHFLPLVTGYFSFVFGIYKID